MQQQKQQNKPKLCVNTKLQIDVVSYCISVSHIFSTRLPQYRVTVNHRAPVIFSYGIVFSGISLEQSSLYYKENSATTSS